MRSLRSLFLIFVIFLVLSFARAVSANRHRQPSPSSRDWQAATAVLRARIDRHQDSPREASGRDWGAATQTLRSRIDEQRDAPRQSATNVLRSRGITIVGGLEESGGRVHVDARLSRGNQQGIRTGGDFRQVGETRVFDLSIATRRGERIRSLDPDTVATLARNVVDQHLQSHPTRDPVVLRTQLSRARTTVEVIVRDPSRRGRRTAIAAKVEQSGSEARVRLTSKPDRSVPQASRDEALRALVQTVIAENDGIRSVSLGGGVSYDVASRRFRGGDESVEAGPARVVSEMRFGPWREAESQSPNGGAFLSTISMLGVAGTPLRVQRLYRNRDVGTHRTEIDVDFRNLGRDDGSFRGREADTFNAGTRAEILRHQAVEALRAGGRQGRPREFALVRHHSGANEAELVVATRSGEGAEAPVYALPARVLRTPEGMEVRIGGHHRLVPEKQRQGIMLAIGRHLAERHGVNEVRIGSGLEFRRYRVEEDAFLSNDAERRVTRGTLE